MPPNTASVAAPSPPEVRAGVRATYIAFIGSGFAFANIAQPSNATSD